MKILTRNVLLNVFSHQTLALLRWDIHFLWIRIINYVLLRERRLHKKLRDLRHPLYLNLGSGPRGLNSANWINVDGYKDTNVMYYMDFNRDLPFQDNSFAGVFCEHVLEHFDIEDGQRILRECCRVLQPGGCIRIIVPDGRKIMHEYFNNPSGLLQHRNVDTNCAMEAVNSYFRQRYEHKIAYDEELLGHQLSKAGFERIASTSFGKGGASSAVIIDNEKYAWESLYMEASKPSA